MASDAILVLDFGGQYCHLIGRRVRDSGVYSEVVPYDITLDKIEEIGERLNVKGLILSGGPDSIYEKGSPQMDKSILNAKIPVLGICYGHQLVAHYMDGTVKPAPEKEYGPASAKIVKTDGLLRGLDREEKVWMSHGDTVFGLPKEFEVLATTSNCPIASFRHKSMPIYGIQWHPEVTHTKHGEIVLNNFIFDICKCRRSWNVNRLVDRYVQEIRETVGSGRALVALSGGIDSSTTTALASRAIGKKLTAVFVDTGMMRENEARQVRDAFRRFELKLIVVDAKKRFLRRLKGIIDPEKKRMIIGEEFIRVFEEVARRAHADYLLQGTIYPDRIESGQSKRANKIKSHHNVAGLPDNIRFKALLEPLKDLYKDEVRRLAFKLGLPIEMIYRQPFPGPGLAVRVVGEITEEKLKMLRKADAIANEEIAKSSMRGKMWQSFAVLTDTKSTGVKGDARSYGYVIAIRGVESTEAMTANFAKIPYPVLERISTRITNEVPGVTRVVYDITDKPPATIEWE